MYKINSLDLDKIKLKETFWKCGELVSQRLIAVLGTDGNMFPDCTSNLFNEVWNIEELIRIIANLKSVVPAKLILDIVTFKGSPVLSKHVDRLLNMGIKLNNIHFFSWWVWVDNFMINSKELVQNMPFYSRRNTALATIKLIEEFWLNINPTNTIIIGRWVIGQILSLNYGNIKQISSSDATLLKKIEWRQNIIIATALNDKNKSLVNKQFLDVLPSNANIINISRKELVNEESLKSWDGKYFADVYYGEVNQNPKNFDNVVYIKQWKIILRVNWIDKPITKEQFTSIKKNIVRFLTPHIFWRAGYLSLNKWRKVYMYRKLLWQTEKNISKLLSEITNTRFNFIEMITK